MKSEIEDKIIKKMDESIEKVLEGELSVSDADTLYKLVKTRHVAKEDKEMNYGNYYGNYGGRRAGYDSYGRGGYGNYGDGSYGARGRDRRYRGDDSLDRMSGEYGRYNESRERYGAGEETDKSFHYMVKALEDFIKVLYEEAETQQQQQQLMQTLQNSMR